jgi:hypothetical protein
VRKSGVAHEGPGGVQPFEPSQRFQEQKTIIGGRRVLEVEDVLCRASAIRYVSAWPGPALRRITRIKRLIRTLSRLDACELLRQSLQMDDASEVRELLTDAFDRAGLGGLVRADPKRSGRLGKALLVIRSVQAAASAPSGHRTSRANYAVQGETDEHTPGINRWDFHRMEFATTGLGEGYPG